MGNWAKGLRGRVARWRKALHLAPHIDDIYEAFEERGDNALTKHDRELLENALSFSAITADKVGMPRAEIVHVPVTATYEQVLAAFVDSAHSRLPVAGRGLDDIKGMLTLKDLIGVVAAPEGFAMARLLRPVPFVPENMTLPRVLQVMKRTRTPLVVVTDEFGGTSGLVTLKDILEELVGDLDDEHEEAVPAPLLPVGGNRYRVQGDYTLEDLDGQFGTNLAEVFGNEVETLGGAVLRVAKTVPPKGSHFVLSEGVEATVLASDGRRVLGLELQIQGHSA